MRREQVEIANPLTSRLRVTTAWQASLSRFAKGRRESAAIQSYSIAQAPPLLCYTTTFPSQLLHGRLEAVSSCIAHQTQRSLVRRLCAFLKPATSN